MRLAVAVLSVVGIVLGLSGAVGGTVRALDDAESLAITGGACETCCDDAFCNPGNNDCKDFNFFHNMLRECPSMDGTCFFCDADITAGGCQGGAGGEGMKCRYNGSVDCEFLFQGICEGNECNNMVSTTACVDMPQCEDQSGSCPW